MKKSTLLSFFLLYILQITMQAQTHTFYIVLKSGEKIENIRILREPKKTNWQQVSFYAKEDPEKTIKTYSPEQVDSFSTIIDTYVTKTYKDEEGQEKIIFVALYGNTLVPLYKATDEKGHEHLFIQKQNTKALVSIPHWKIREFLSEMLPSFDDYVHAYKIGPLTYDTQKLTSTLENYAAYLYPDKYKAPKNIANNNNTLVSVGIELSPGFRQMTFKETSVEFDNVNYTAYTLTAGALLDIQYTPKTSVLIRPQYTFYDQSLRPDTVDVRRNTFFLPFSYRYTHFTGARIAPFAELGFHVGINVAADLLKTQNNATKGFSLEPLYGGWQAGLGLKMAKKYGGDLSIALHYSQSSGKVVIRTFPSKKETLVFQFATLVLGFTF